ncbi:MAG: ABC transporter permease [Lactobacillus sp.]|jgi:ABC-2 type transport system permease protein|nr:ABC transporter permease [Lactobacillus sp.]
MNKLWIVTAETYLRQVKTWSFLILILSPFIFFGISAGAGYFAGSSTAGQDKIAVISQQQPLRQQVIRQNKGDVNQKIITQKAAEKAVKAEDLAGYLILSQSGQRVKAVYHSTRNMDDTLKKQVQASLSQYQQALNLNEAKLTPQQTQALQQQPIFQQQLKEKQKDDSLAKLLSFWIMAFLAYMILTTYASITAQEIASEKGTKIMEIIFSSTTARKYFFGKILGVLLVILTQIGIYLGGGVLCYLLAQRLTFSREFLADNHTLISAVLHNLVNINLLYLLLGVVLFTVLSAFSGALVAKAEDASKAATPAVYLNMIAFFSTFPFQGNTHSIVVTILSYVPFFSSYFMPFRMINYTVSPVEITISLLILVVTIIGSAAYIGSIYEGLMLQTDDSSFFKRFKRGLSYRKQRS